MADSLITGNARHQEKWISRKFDGIDFDGGTSTARLKAGRKYFEAAITGAPVSSHRAEENTDCRSVIVKLERLGRKLPAEV